MSLTKIIKISIGKYIILICAILFCLFALWSNVVQAAIVRPDETFGDNGTVFHHNAAGGNGNDMAFAIQKQTDGKYVVVGISDNSSDSGDLVIWRFKEDGSLDDEFNGTGFVVHDNPLRSGYYELVYDLLIDKEGRYVMVGEMQAPHSPDMTIWRLNSDGKLDTSFNGSGYVQHSADGRGSACGHDIELQSDGKYVVVGYNWGPSGINAKREDFTIWRFNNDGSVDTSFAGNGYFTQNAAAGGNREDIGYGIEILSDGKYLVTGLSTDASEHENMALWKFNPDGTLDTSFADMGYITLSSAFGNGLGAAAYDLGVTEDGKYVVVGKSYKTEEDTDLTIWKFNPDGTFDNEFGKEGIITMDDTSEGDGFEQGRSLSITENEKYVIAGSSSNDPDSSTPTLWKFNSDGTLDQSFRGGVQILNLPANEGKSYGMDLIEDEGSYLVTGIAKTTRGDSDIFLYKLISQYQIQNLDYDLSAYVGDEDITEGASQVGTFGAKTITLKSEDVDAAEVDVDMSEDRDWKQVQVLMDKDKYRALYKGLVSAPGVSGTYTIFMPRKDKDEIMNICPEVSSIDEVKTGCKGMIKKTIEDKDVSIIDIDGVEYFQISNVEQDIGVFSGEGTGSPLMMVIIGIFATIVLFAGLVLVIVIKMRKTKEQ